MQHRQPCRIQLLPPRFYLDAEETFADCLQQAARLLRCAWDNTALAVS